MAKYGLDFGTTNSSISVSYDGKSSKVVAVDRIASDPRVVRSMIYFLRREMVYGPKVPQSRILSQEFYPGDIEYVGESKYLIGQEAINTYINDNRNRRSGVKRKMYTGRWVIPTGAVGANPVPEYYEEIDYGTGRLLQALKSSLKTHYKGTNIFGKYFLVEELIGKFVSQLKETAEKESGETIDEITVGRPVHFSENRDIDQKAQDRLAVAMKSAGFKKLKFQYEPVAAAKQFVSGEEKKGQIILVFDFGGGTLDTALVKVGEKTQVLATDGVYIGGDLLNADIMQTKLWNYFGFNTYWGDNLLEMPPHIYEALGSWFSIPNLNNPTTMNLLDRVSYKNTDPQAVSRLVHLIKMNLGFEVYEAIEKAKKELSTQEESRIVYQNGQIDLDMAISRKEFERIIQFRVNEIEKVVSRTLEKAKLEPGQIDKVVRTGGSSLIPVFEKMLERIFGKEKVALFETFTSIAAGLALE